MKCFLTNHDPIGKDEELDIRSKGTEHQAARHHDSTEDCHGTSPKVVYTGTADRTWGRRVSIQKETKWTKEEQKIVREQGIVMMLFCLSCIRDNKLIGSFMVWNPDFFPSKQIKCYITCSPAADWQLGHVSRTRLGFRRDQSRRDFHLFEKEDSNKPGWRVTSDVHGKCEPRLSRILFAQHRLGLGAFLCNNFTSFYRWLVFFYFLFFIFCIKEAYTLTSLLNKYSVCYVSEFLPRLSLNLPLFPSLLGSLRAKSSFYTHSMDDLHLLCSSRKINSSNSAQGATKWPSHCCFSPSGRNTTARRSL